MSRMKERARRVQLAVPGDSERKLAKAASLKVDHVFLDLEDAVAPAEKARARGMTIDALNTLDWGRTIRCVRVNDIDSPWFIRDLTELIAGAGERIDTLMIPKVRHADEIRFIERLLGMLERDAGLTRPIGLEIIVEEVQGLSNLDTICAAGERLESAVLGVGDYSASQRIDRRAINGHPDYPGDIWHYARFRLLVACRANGMQAIDAPFVDLRDPEGYRRHAQQGQLMGFDGKWALHPDQIPLAVTAFTPSEAEVRHAREVCAAFDQYDSQGVGIFAYDGVVMDLATVRSLRNTLMKAELFGLTY
jgi:citrate lyase subunit beta/citryl-CoA lyase